MRRINMIKKQAIFFGILDSIIFVVVSLIVLLLNISLINRISKAEALLHTIIGLSFGIITRFIILVYKQNWKKFPIYGVVRVVLSETTASIAHYILQDITNIKRIPLIHIFAISLISVVLQIGIRILFYIRNQKLNDNNKIYLSSPTMYEEEQKYIEEAFDRNWVAPLGFNCDGFENEMVDYLGDDLYAFATSSGTAALHLAAKLAGIKPGDVVLCSDLTFAATVNPMTYEGGKLVFIDSEYDSWNMSPKALEEGFKKYPNAKVVVLVHLYGTPGKIDEILEICKKHNAVLIEDAAEALGATYKGNKCGTFGEYNVLSFNGNKIITTSGGGMLLTKQEKERNYALNLGTQARENAIWYEHKEIGYNYRMSNVVAGIGRGQLLHLEHHKDRKTEIYKIYEEAFKDTPVKMNPYLKDTCPNFWLSCLMIDENYICEHSRTNNSYTYIHEKGKTCPDEIFDELKKNNIETRPIWKPMHMQPIFKDNDFIKNPDYEKPVSEDIFDRGICLPSDIKMEKDNQLKIINIIKSLFRE